MFKAISSCAAFLAFTALPTLTFASEVEDMTIGYQCMKAKPLVKMIKKTEDMKPEKVDTVKTFATMNLKAKEGGKLPERVFYRHADAEVPLNVDAKGDVVDFRKLGSLSKKGELCMSDPEWVGKAREDVRGGLSLGISFDVGYINKSGAHSMAELLDGAKDGKSHYKKMFPGPLAILVPKMTHVGIAAQKEDEDSGRTISVEARKSGEVLSGLNVETFGGMQVINLDELQILGADTLHITGGEYALTPVPSIEKMKKLGFGTDNEGEDESSDTPD